MKDKAAAAKEYLKNVVGYEASPREAACRHICPKAILAFFRVVASSQICPPRNTARAVPSVFGAKVDIFGRPANRFNIFNVRPLRCAPASRGNGLCP